MGKIINSYIFPHPPIIVPGIGGGRESGAAETIEACQEIAREIYKDAPDTIIISSPHAPCFSDFIFISDTERLTGNFGDFGHPEIIVNFENNAELAIEIINIAQENKINAGFLSELEKAKFQIYDKIDHGTMVPLHFVMQELEKNRHMCKVVHISTPFLSSGKIYNFGKCIKKAVEKSNENCVYIASGDLSHRLTPDAPAGYTPKGIVYDRKLVEFIRNADVSGLLSIGSNEMEEAGECGTKSFIMLFGANDNENITSKIYSYEGPFGVGYLVAKISKAHIMK